MKMIEEYQRKIKGLTELNNNLSIEVIISRELIGMYHVGIIPSKDKFDAWQSIQPNYVKFHREQLEREAYEEMRERDEYVNECRRAACEDYGICDD